MDNKPDTDLVEYVYYKKSFKNTLWILCSIWLVLRITRAILLHAVGIAVVGTIPFAMIAWATGVVIGMIIVTVYIYRQSIAVNDLETTKSRIKHTKSK